MFKRMTLALSGAMRKTGSALKNIAAKLRGIRLSRPVLARAGYYAALACLLALLGSASNAYRTRSEAIQEPKPSPQPRAVSAVQSIDGLLAPKITPEPVRWMWPLDGEVVGGYSPDSPVWSKTLLQWQTHPGIDIAGEPGEAVYACGDGVVADAWQDILWGNVIVLEHEDGSRSTYAGLNTLSLVSAGDAVSAGDVISAVGETASCEADLGWHLHFEFERDGKPVDFRALAPRP